ncbi:MAG: glycosyltransferase [Chloroflexi bacterium]|nr:glycosyltransferase [Chloroflexota bacterium]
MISIIIPAHNAQAIIAECVTAVLQQRGVPQPYEVIVVDDGSDDETAQRATAAGATVIQQPPRGPAAARNNGLRAAQGDIICFTDADCVPQPDWLAALVAPLLADEGTTAVKGRYITQQKELTARFVQLEYEDKYDRLLNYDAISFMDSYSAACRRQALLDNNGFDEQFTTASVEDRELSYRLASRGYKMVFQPRAVVAHTHAHTLPAYGRKKFFNGYWNARVVRQFPERLIEDTYTPHSQKLQIALMGVIVASTAVSLLLPFVWLLTFLLTVIFLASTLPFLGKAWRRDKAVMFIAPFMLGLRALALGFGYLCGLLQIDLG